MELLFGLILLVLGQLMVFWLGAQRRGLLSVLWVAFVIRFALALVNAYLFPLPDSQRDAIVFERLGWEWAREGWGAVVHRFRTGASLYVWVIAVIYTLTGRNPLVIQGVNVILGTINVYWVWRISAVVTHGNNAPALHAAWMAALWPTLNLYSAITLRESFIMFPALIGIHKVLVWWERGQLRHLIGGIVALLLSMAFHTGMLSLLVGVFGAVVVRWFKALRRGKGVAFVRSTISLGLLVGLGVFVVTTSFGLDKFALLSEGLGRHQEIVARDRTAYLEDAVVETPMDLVWVTPLRILYFLFSPFPWMVKQTADLVGFLDSLMYVWTSYVIVSRLNAIVGNRRLLLLSSLAGLLIVAFALATSNYGTAIRHRAKVAPLMIIIAAVVTARSTGVARGDRT